jgi:AbrB family looped-hinge helix DNA binding protein
MSVVRVSAKGQVTIPAEVQKLLGIKAGSYVRFVVHKNGVSIEAAEHGIRALKGSVTASEQQDFASIRQKVMEEVAYGVARESEGD